jgi:hypothetical protein
MAGSAAMTIFSTIKSPMAKVSHANPRHEARNTVSVTVWTRDGGCEIWISTGMAYLFGAIGV